jgi:hypothetical protein
MEAMPSGGIRRGGREPAPGARRRHWMRVALGATLAGPVALAAGLVPVSMPTAAAGTPLPGAPNCPIFPADNVWNTRVTSLPVNSHSAQWLASMDSSTTDLHPTFGPSTTTTSTATPYGIPYTVVSPSHPLVSIAFTYATQSDPGPYPFGSDTRIEGGPTSTGDRHAIMVNPATCTLYELWDARYSPTGSTAGSGAIWNLESNALRPAGWTSADAAGLPILPGLVRYDEVQDGQITHAIRMTAEVTDTAYIWPARHEAGSVSTPNYPPMGARFRLKSTFDISGYSPQARVVLRAMQQYGLILADNGSNWYFQGTANAAWPISLIDELKTIPASAFQAVDESSLMVTPNSGQAGTPIVPGPGYRLVGADGGVFSFGAPFFGSTGGLTLASPIVGTADTPDGGGYWLVAADGGVFSFGDARFYGSMGGKPLDAPIVGMAPTADGGGYWLVAADGGIFSFGDARFSGSTGGLPLDAPIVGMAAVPGGSGYWLVAADGGIFSFGDARFYGSTGGMHLNRPVVGMAAVPGGGGYWLVAADGGVFTFGTAPFLGSPAAAPLNQPVVSLRPLADGDGYWLVAADGGVFAYGAANFHGSTADSALNAPIVAMG